ncbi:hypothetical protein KCV87_22435 [Actinosynnema pretiosum subsp. pretiosum]|uniref:Uncharacterized protein n=3 Tax=Actinosynnema TaxID=40566 RepID=C6WNE3_ACTMD|nr:MULTISPECIES: hypothetical protein [Actinosynnema]ACU40507.1 hypothetical protein Amir_6710 [Actinosynnema mirum DSM 43827]ATE58519.1 hypothetical protein CNX65_33070 [Actinosynnema pretiosum]QUF02241.1 hypothetical protein KCV87_22435 [Actinosynnema pretiosum subsp. pretiosum]
MLYVLALIGALTIAVLLWRAFGSARPESVATRRFVAPDDDPEFLRKLGEQQSKQKRQDEE